MNELSPLRYPGGKARVSAYMRRIMELNNLGDAHYVEPYAGGAGVAFDLLFSEMALVIHINDLDGAIFAFWRAVLDDTDGICRRISAAPLSVDEWKRQRQVQFAPDPDPGDLAFSTFYLNRTNRSGIIRSGGVIGGHGQTGQWKLDARFNRLKLIKRIQRIATYRSRIRLTNLDAAALLQNIEVDLPNKALIYLDPPYYVKGRGLYANFYRHEDHEAISALVAGLQVPWIVSYDNVAPIRTMYTAFRAIEYDLQYSARERHDGKEVMFFSPKLRLPDIPDPSQVQPRRSRRRQRTSVLGLTQQCGSLN